MNYLEQLMRRYFAIGAAIETLSPMTQAIIKAKFLCHKPLAECAKNLKITKEHYRQREARALRELHEALYGTLAIREVLCEIAQ